MLQYGLQYVISRIHPLSVEKSKSSKIGYTICRWLSSKPLHPTMKTAVTRLSWRRRGVLSAISRTYSGIMLRYWWRSLIANYVYYSTLKTINNDLDEISAQGRWKLGIFSDLNTTAVDGCLNSLSVALENFRVCAVSGVHGLGAWYDPFYSLLAIFATPASSSHSTRVCRRTRIWLLICTKT